MSSCVTVPSRRRPLAAGIAMMFVLAAPVAQASTWVVDNTCGDDINSGDLGAKTGTLRFCANNAAPTGDTIDLSQTTCSQITLTTGAITLAQQVLTVHGAGKNQTIVSGKDGSSIEPDRIFFASYEGGNITFDHLTVAFGQLTGSAGHVNGGCIYSKGSITLDNVGAYYCTATTTGTVSTTALGGAVYAHALTIRNGSSLLHNGVYATQPTIQAQGGGRSGRRQLLPVRQHRRAEQRCYTGG